MYFSRLLSFIFTVNVGLISAVGDFGFGHIGSNFGSGIGRFGSHGLGSSHEFIGPKYLGGSDVFQKHYGEGNKAFDDEYFHKNFGKEDAVLNHGQSGFSKGEDAFKNIKGDSRYTYGTDGNKGQHYNSGDEFGSKHFGKEGKSGGETANKEGHKKGHVVKGYSTSHHKDEHGKTEEFYDDEHNEGDNTAFNGHSGQFGETSETASKGGHQDGKYSSGDSSKGVHYESELIDGKVQSNHGHFGENKHADHGAVLGNHKLSGVGDASGHHEFNSFQKHQPSFI